MSEAYAAKLQKTHTLVWMFLGMLLYKFFMDLGYLYLTRVSDYILAFNPLKYAAGLLWCIVLFLAIRHTERKASTFFLYFIFLFQIVPITSVYAMKDESSSYYHLLCLSFLLCELAVSYTGDRPIFRRTFPVSRAMTLAFTAAALLLLVYLVLKNGAPKWSLLDTSTVYEYRTSGALQLSKYMGYLLDWTTKVFLPFALAKTLTDRRYLPAAALGVLQILIYLYTGHKTFLFSVPFILLGSLWARRKNCYRELFLTGCAGFSILTLLANFTEPGSPWYYLFSVFVRRVMVLPAQLKFQYFDYFTSHPKLGIYGILPTWILKVPSYYEDVGYTYDIAAIYYNKPEMNANTGFFAEGYMRFGCIGIILLPLLLALLLKQMDRFQDRAGYILTISIFIYPIQLLSDGHLLDSLVFDHWMFLTAILLFYQPRRMPPEPPSFRLQRRRLALRLPALRLRP